MKMQKRDVPYIHPSWLAKLISGDVHCEHRFHTKAHFKWQSAPPDAKLTLWNIKHTKMIRDQAAILREQGFETFIESQNDFRIEVVSSKRQPPGGYSYSHYNIEHSFVVSGKPDLVALSEDENLIIDCKSGKPRASHGTQILLYQIFMPMMPQYKNVKFNGVIIYGRGIKNTDIAFSMIDDSLRETIWDVMKSLAGPGENCRTVQSFSECRFCDVPDCPTRVVQ